MLKQNKVLVFIIFIMMMCLLTSCAAAFSDAGELYMPSLGLEDFDENSYL